VPGRDEDTESCRIDERQLVKVKQDPGGEACLGFSQRTLELRALREIELTLDAYGAELTFPRGTDLK
jgi:hypothetical protein